jgi:hypothetical protein
VPSYPRSALAISLTLLAAIYVSLLASPRQLGSFEGESFSTEYRPNAWERSVDADWKTVLPEAELIRLVEDSVKFLQDATRSTTALRTQAKPAENRAYVLLICAQAGLNGDGDLAKKSAVLKSVALNLAEAIKKQDLATAKKQVEVLAKFKSMKPDGKTEGGEIDLAKSVPIASLMKEVGETDKKLQDAKRLTAAAFTAKGKADEIATLSYKMAALTMAITAHVPEKDPDPKETDKDKQQMTRKLWLESTAESRDATLEMAAAAKAKKASDFKAAYSKMDSACTRCHDVFRKTE